MSDIDHSEVQTFTQRKSSRKQGYTLFPDGISTAPFRLIIGLIPDLYRRDGGGTCLRCIYGEQSLLNTGARSWESRFPRSQD